MPLDDAVVKATLGKQQLADDVRHKTPLTRQVEIDHQRLWELAQGGYIPQGKSTAVPDEVISMHYGEGQSLHQAASRIGVDEAAIRNSLKKALYFLAKPACQELYRISPQHLAAQPGNQ